MTGERRSPRELDLEDRLTDLLTGFKMWKESKVGRGDECSRGGLRVLGARKLL